MKIGMKGISAVMLIVLIAVSTTIVFALPEMPHQFYGEVTIDGLPAPDGTWVDIVIVTADGGEFYYSTETSEGLYGYDPLFKIPADDPETTEIEGGVNGDTVYFYVELVYATSYAFENGHLTSLDLDVTTSVYQLQLYEGWNLIGIPCIPEVPYIELMLYDIIDYVESVWTYDGETGYWSSYSPGAPSDLTEMVDGKGYWIKMTTDVLWEIDI